MRGRQSAMVLSIRSRSAPSRTRTTYAGPMRLGELGVAVAMITAAVAHAPSRVAAEPAPVRGADEAQARAHFKQGKVFLDRQLYSEAIKEFELAYQQAPLPALLYNIAQAYRLEGDLDKAIETYQRFLATEAEGQAADEAREHVADLIKQRRDADEQRRMKRAIPLEPAPQPPAPVTSVTPAPVAPAPVTPAPVAPEPGISAAERRTVSSQPDDSGPMSGRRRISLVTGALGLAGMAVGTWAALDARHQRDDARELGCNDNLSLCPADALGSAQRAYSRGNLSTGFFIGGVALVSASVVLWLVSPAHVTSDSMSWQIAPSVTPADVSVTVSRGF